MGEPFLVREVGSLTFSYRWNDWGTGGEDWGFAAHTVPDGYGRLGDAVHRCTMNLTRAPGPGDLGCLISTRVLLVRTDRPDSAVPCTGYETIRYVSGNLLSTVFKPTHPDPNYIAIGHVVNMGRDVPPPVGEYYLVHRKHLIDRGLTATLELNNDWVPCFRTIPGYTMFRVGDIQKYTLRNDDALKSCCTGSGSDCATWSKGSVDCQLLMSESCKASDIKPGGKCEDWCARDPVSCDKLKNKFCGEHPDDPFCDCINAFSRADHAAFIKDKEVIYSQSIPACYYSKCKLGPYKVFTTTAMDDAQNGERCKSDLQYIDQKINVSGDNNILNTSQDVTNNKGPVNNNAAPEQTVAGIPVMTILLVLIAVLVLGGGYMYMTGDDPTQQIQPMQPMQPMQQDQSAQFMQQPYMQQDPSMQPYAYSPRQPYPMA